MIQPNRAFPKLTRFLKFELSRSEIEQQSTTRALTWLNELISDPAIAWANRSTLVLCVGGYDDDSRELYEIPEVCRFLREINANWKYWFFFASPWGHTLTVLLSCIYGAKKARADVAELPAAKVQKFFLECTLATNGIFEKWHFPEEENKKMYFSAKEILGL